MDTRGETSERLADAVFAELEERALSAGDGYPFSVGDQAIQLGPDALSTGSTNNLLQVLRRTAHGFTNPTNFQARGLLIT